ncbi:MAG: hypothetical protein JXR83_04330 [Deltaproteobacteria bacterium]|nr:hypothetical protein [Deltaproteobacteria bacterium]
MNRRRRLIALLAASPTLLAAAPTATAPPAAPGGTVRLPLEAYQELLTANQQQQSTAPAGYAFGTATIEAEVEEHAGRPSAEVKTEVQLRTLDDKWVLVPVLPVGTALTEASLDNQPVELVSTPSGLAWSTNSPGNWTLALTYRVDAVHSASGYVLALPVPAAASAQLTARLPGTNLDLAVIPAASVRTETEGDKTKVTATLPASRGVQISWRVPSGRAPTTSRANYRGTLRENAISFVAEFGVELFGDESAVLPLLPNKVTLSDVQVDGKPAPVLVADERFATLVKGRGSHRIAASFQVPVIHDDGPPRIELAVLSTPVSRFDLTLPGKKNLEVKPGGSVTSAQRGATTSATAFVPLTEQVEIAWTEAVPEEVSAELRANASIYHSAFVEEGVLHLTATVAIEVTRGETSSVRLAIPADAQINAVQSSSGGIADWRQTRSARGEPAIVTVFLDHPASSDFSFDVQYERLLGSDRKEGDKIALPLLRALDVHRQRGMVALLASRELTLKPVDERQLTKVGENQLPAFVRQTLPMTVAHTYKYLDEAPALAVQAVPPERKEGKYDAQVDTLISIGDVTLKGAAGIEVNVKSGGITALVLDLPPAVNLLSLTGPSLRSHRVQPTDGRQLIDVQFTQEMEGQFRLEANYERILADGESELVVPTLAVRGAEVEQGRIAIEALTAVEVKTARAQQLSSLDINELPQQLVLKTSHPILLGYKYVHVEPPYELALTITRHQELDVQTATIDSARYRTLFTRDGLAVTSARFDVRNSRQQFLRVQLPPGSEVWQVLVDGKTEKPALADAADAGDNASVLIKIINSAQGFAVDLVYASPVAKIGSLGTLRHELPRPDMVVTSSRWDVLLPDGVRYGHPRSNMELREQGRSVSQEELAAQVDGATDKKPESTLRVSVPTSGLLYAFEKLYANRSDQAAAFTISYSSALGAVTAQLLGLIGAVLLWGGGAMTLRRGRRRQRAAGAAIAGLGALVIAVGAGHFGAGLTTALVASALIGAALLGWRLVVRSRRIGATGPAPVPPMPVAP